MEKILGTTPAQRRYEPPTTLATQLGNTEPGDGIDFKDAVRSRSPARN